MMTLKVWRKFLLITLTSWSMIFSTSALAEQGGAPVTPASQPQQENASPADYCGTDDMTAKNCSAGQTYVCHLKKCAASSEAQRYNEEYNDCEVSSNPESCKSDLRGLHDEMDTAQTTGMDVGGKSAGDSESEGADALSIILLGSTSIAMRPAYETTFSGIAAGFASAIALMMKQSVEDNAKAQFEPINAEIKGLEDDGFVVERQIQVFNLLLGALNSMLRIVGDKVKNHEQLVIMWGIVAVMAGFNIAYCSSGFCESAPWIPWAVLGTSVTAAALENDAASASKGLENEIKNAIAVTQKMIDKLSSIYRRDTKSFTMVQPGQGFNTGNNTSGNIAQSLEEYVGTRDGGEGEIGLCRHNGQIIKCPCPDNKCDTVNSNFIPLSSPLGQQIQKVGLVEGLDQALTEFFRGNRSPLDAVFDQERGALARKLRKKLVKMIQNNKNIKKTPEQSSLLSRIATNKLNKKDFAKARMSAVGLAAELKSSEGLSNAQNVAQGIVYDSKRNKGKNVDPLADMKARLAALKKSLNADEDTSVMTASDDMSGGESSKIALHDKTIKDKEQGEAKIHPDTKVSIFKIISNRYNLMRIKKAIGF